MFVKFVRGKQFLVFPRIWKQDYSPVKSKGFSPPAAEAAFSLRYEWFAAIFTSFQSPRFRKLPFDHGAAVIAQPVPRLIKRGTRLSAEGASMLEKEFPQEEQYSL
jgi:hypothetical protein